MEPLDCKMVISDILIDKLRYEISITWPCNSLRAVVAAVSELNLTNPYPFDSPVLWSHITLTTQKHC